MVIGCNFCPFAAKAVLKKTIRYVVVEEGDIESSLELFFTELRLLDQVAEVETTLIIFPHHFADFEDYLDLVELAEALIVEQNYEGVYQVASFHPDYCFEGAEADDPANYTNRSIFPMLHILREDSLSDALDNFPDAEGIPEKNIAFARRQGLKNMQMLRDACIE